MSAGAVVRAAAQLGLLYAAIGVAGTLLVALTVGDLASAVLPAVVLGVTLAIAAVIIVGLARLAVEWLDDRVREPVVVAIMFVCALVLLSGVLTVPSLGVWAVAVSALLALATHAVLTRHWA